jgi:predicted porin
MNGGRLGSRIPIWLLVAAGIPLGAIPAAGFGMNAGDLDGHIEVGVRSVDVDGDEAKYHQHVNLDDGVRLLEARFSYRPSATDAPGPDLVLFEARGLGGDPYENIKIEVREYSRYRLQYRRHVSDYFYEDLLIDPDLASIEGSTGGDFHHFDFERTRDLFALDLELHSVATLHFDYQRYERHGDSTTVYDIEREEFELEQPINDTLDVYGLGLELQFDRWTVIWNERLRQFETNTGVFLAGASEGSDPDEPTALDFFVLDQPYKYDTHEHELRVLARPIPALEIRFDAQFTDLELDLDVHETTLGTDYTGAPISVDASGSGEAERDTHLLELAASYVLNDRFSLTASLGRRRLDQTADLLFGAEPAISEWTIDTDQYSIGADMLMGEDWHLSAGWSVDDRETRSSSDSNGDTRQSSLDSDRHGYYVSLAWRPQSDLSVDFSYEDDSIDDPLALASPTDRNRFRLRGRFQFDNGLALTGSYRLQKIENDHSGWESDSGQLQARISQTTERLAWSLGYTRADVEHSIDQLVTGGFRQDLFRIDYTADTTYADANLRWLINDRFTIGGWVRIYENDSVFHAERDDTRLFATYQTPERYTVTLAWRNIDFEEDDLEAFDARIVELSFTYGW